jgi:hypothetical protein
VPIFDEAGSPMSSKHRSAIKRRAGFLVTRACLLSRRARLRQKPPGGVAKLLRLLSSLSALWILSPISSMGLLPALSTLALRILSGPIAVGAGVGDAGTGDTLMGRVRGGPRPAFDSPGLPFGSTRAWPSGRGLCRRLAAELFGLWAVSHRQGYLMNRRASMAVTQVRQSEPQNPPTAGACRDPWLARSRPSRP